MRPTGRFGEGSLPPPPLLYGGNGGGGESSAQAISPRHLHRDERWAQAQQPTSAPTRRHAYGASSSQSVVGGLPSLPPYAYSGGASAFASSSSLPAAPGLHAPPLPPFQHHSYHRYYPPPPATSSMYAGQRSIYSAGPTSVSSSRSPPSAWTQQQQQHSQRHRDISFRSDSQTSPQQPEERKRQRIQQACKACSVRRVRCNGARPCQVCTKNGEECVYGIARKRGPAKGTTRGGRKDSTTQRRKSTSAGPSGNEERAGERSTSEKEEKPRKMRSPGRQNKTTYPAQHPSQYTAQQDYTKARREDEWSDRDPRRYPPVSPSHASFYPGSYPDRSHQQAPPPPHSTYYTPEGEYPRSRQYPDYMPPGDTNPHYENEHVRAPPPHAREHLPYRHHEGVPSASYAPEAPFDAYYDQRGPARQYRESIQGGRESVAGSAPDTYAGPPVQQEASGMIAPTSHQRENRGGSKPVSAADTVPTAAEVRRDEPQSIDNGEGAVVSDDIRDRLFRVFWTVIWLHWPMFPRQAFPTVEDFRRAIDPRHPLLVNAICSISALTWDSKRDGGDLDTRPPDEALSARQLSKIFSIRAHYHHIAAILEPSLESTAALVLLSLRETGAGRPSQAAHYCWTACRMAMDLSLHRHAETAQIMGTAFTFVEDEMRRRIYWSVYVIDKMMAVQLGRPPVLRDSESDCPLPSFTGDQDVYALSSLPKNFFSDETNRKTGPQPLTVATYFRHGCQLACVSEGIIAQYNVVKSKKTQQQGSTPPLARGSDAAWQQNVVVIHHRLEQWERDTPENLKWKSKAAEAYFPFVIHQQVWAQACKILLHRPYILKPTDPASGINSHAECSKATDTIWQMFCDYERLFTLKRIPSSMVYCLFSAATVALANTTSTDDDVSGKAKHQLRHCVRWFVEMTEIWTSATQHLAILENLASTINVNLPDTGLQGEALRIAMKQNSDIGGAGSSNPIEVLQGAIAAPQLGFGTGSSGGGIWAASSLASSRPLAGEGQGVALPSQHAEGLPWLSAQAAAQLSVPITGEHDMAAAAHAATTNATTAAVTALIAAPVGAAHDPVQALDAFWPDMPLGEDLQRWISFTQTYVGALGNASNPVSSAAESGVMGTGSVPAVDGLPIHQQRGGDNDVIRSEQALPPATSTDSFYPTLSYPPTSNGRA